MSDNENQNMAEKINEAKKQIEGASKLAANISSGNVVGAVKEGLNLLKNKEFRKKIKRKIIMHALKVLAVLIMVVSIVGVVAEITNTVIDILANANTSMSSFFTKAWQWLTNDYWIDLNEEREYTINVETGETVEPGTAEDEYGNPITTEIETLTLIDKYVKELGNQGVSIKDLGLLGTADYSDPNLLNDEENKALVEKYMAEFIRADIITQQPHRNKSNDVVNSNNQNLVDGSIYFYRAKKEPEIDESKFADGNYSEENIPDDVEYVEMKYISNEEFYKMFNEKDKDLRLKFTIDQDTGELMVVKVKKIVTTNARIPTDMGWFNNIAAWFNEQTSKKTEYQYEIKRIDYRKEISKYTMPYEFLIQLCSITHNPEFVYHVALMARDSKIEILIQDDVTLERETEDRLEEYKTYINYSDSSIEGASVSSERKEKNRKVKTITTETPKMAVRMANTWSYYEEFQYTKNIKGTKVDGDIIVEEYTPTGPLNHVPERESWDIADGATSIAPAIVPEHWEKELLVRSETGVQTINVSVEYNSKDKRITLYSIHKSKQFLGLLRNKTGECEEKDCYKLLENPMRYQPTALDCVRKSVFERQGKNVKYTIPNQTKKEEPIEELLSGLDLLYSKLLLNNSGYTKTEEKDAGELYEEEQLHMEEGDYESAYVSKMQGLVEHLSYLMEFPDNEEDIPIDYMPGDDDDDDEDYETNIEDGEFLEIAKQCHDFLMKNEYFYSSEANKKRGGPPTGWKIGVKDGTSTGRNIPIPTTNVEDAEKRYIDCSAYVSWVLYEAGYRGSGWQWGSGYLLNNPMCFEEVSISDMKPGDILVKSGHAEIYAGNGRSYSCGSTRSIRKDTVSTMKGIQKVFRAP